MIHDPRLIEWLGSRPTSTFDGEVFRATPVRLNPLAPSTRGGRWVPPGETSVLYTSLAHDGALAEIAFHWGMLTPLPDKPVALHRLRVTAQQTLRLIDADLAQLGADPALLPSLNYQRTQEVGAVVAWLGCDGLIVPSARWTCENLVLFTDNHGLEERLEVAASETVDWQAWARDKGLLADR